MQFGEGGDDSKIFVHQLLAAYCKYASNLNLKSEVLDSSEGHVMAKFSGRGAAEAFQHESGKHVIQRIPPTETKGRKQTSVVSVAILPIKEDEWESLKDGDLDIETVNLGGKGGQHQNKTESGVRMIHKPTGFKVTINGRDQHANKREARKILTAKVNKKLQEDKDEAYGENRKGQMKGGGRSDKTRTYNLLKSRVVDHNLGTKTKNVKAVLEKGKFDLLF